MSNNTIKVKAKGASRFVDPPPIRYQKWQLDRDVQAEIQARVARNATKLLNAQMNIAEGCTFLFVKRKDRKGNFFQAEQITDPEIIRQYVDGELASGEDYYYISTQRPENNAINSLFDRAFGKPIQKTELTGKDGGAIALENVSLLKLAHSMTPAQKMEELKKLLES